MLRDDKLSSLMKQMLRQATRGTDSLPSMDPAADAVQRALLHCAWPQGQGVSTHWLTIRSSKADWRQSKSNFAAK